MFTFRTEVNPDPSAFRINHETKILFTGSCFATAIGSYLKSILFQVRINPFGVVYNPLSVLNTLGILIDEKKYVKEDLVFFNDLWFSWDHHSSFSHPDCNECLKLINKEIAISSKHLKESRFLFITFGTAWIYKLRETGKIVSNCHKVPASEFDRIRLEPDDITIVWKNFLEELFAINTDLRIVFTISPVRHWKDGAHGNQLSKSVLLLAIDKLVNLFPGKTEYFPAYEILLDDLRDYRFFTDDLLHPNSQAIEYIQEKFNHTYFDSNTMNINRDILKLLKARSHRIYNKTSKAYDRFKAEQLQIINHLSVLYPYINFDEMKEFFTLSRT